MHESKMDYRLTTDDIEHDPTYMVGAFPSAAGTDWYPPDDYMHVEYFAERIMWRILGVAKAYDLHFPSQLAPNKTDRSVLRLAQVQSLEDQLEFLMGLLNDKLIVEAIQKILKVAEAVSRRPNELELVFEGP